jgi:dTDP-4-amino-4,6-dideoxygalactose transaminase
LNAKWDRFEEQAERREENGLHLDEHLGPLPGIYPQRRTADCTRHAYHLYSFRIDPDELGISRKVFLEALAAEGVPAVAGYPIPLYREKMFTDAAFGPYGASIDHDYTKTNCPQCEILSTEQGVWLLHSVLLGTRSDMDDVVAAVGKVCRHREELVVNS